MGDKKKKKSSLTFAFNLKARIGVVRQKVLEGGISVGGKGFFAIFGSDIVLLIWLLLLLLLIPFTSIRVLSTMRMDVMAANEITPLGNDWVKKKKKKFRKLIGRKIRTLSSRL